MKYLDYEIIQRTSFDETYLDKDGIIQQTVMHIVTKNGINVMPGGAWARSQDDAMQMLEVFLVVDRNADKFWMLLNAIRRERNH